MNEKCKRVKSEGVNFVFVYLFYLFCVMSFLIFYFCSLSSQYCALDSHRKEGYHVGEFGMVGFANANYWANAFSQTAAAGATNTIMNDDLHFPHQALYDAVQAIVMEYCNDDETASTTITTTTNKAIMEWGRQYGFLGPNESNSHNSNPRKVFDPRAIHALCATVWKENDGVHSSPFSLQAFAERVATAELRVLLDYALAQTGYKMPDTAATTASTITTTTTDGTATDVKSAVVVNTDLATTATRKVSSAHLENFLAQGSIVLRRMVVINDDNDDANDENSTTQHTFSVAAGIACRLLQAPACRRWSGSIREATTTNNNILHVFVAKRDISDTSMGCGGGYLGKGDVWCCTHTHESLDEDSNKHGTAMDVYHFVATTANDPRADHVDPLYGTRGETPTTVIQWSKGTIF